MNTDLAIWFLHLHKTIAWWVPGLLAMSIVPVTWLVVFLLFKPGSISKSFFSDTVRGLSFFALFILYILWFALPYPLVEEILLLVLIGVSIYLPIKRFKYRSAKRGISVRAELGVIEGGRKAE